MNSTAQINRHYAENNPERLVRSSASFTTKTNIQKNTVKKRENELSVFMKSITKSHTLSFQTLGSVGV